MGKATLISPNINSPDCEASINLSSDGTNLLVYKDDNGDGNIYESELKGNEWSKPKYEMSPINSSAWETHACYSSDNRVLYFVSDREGGFGGRDIYKCLRLPNGKWGPAQNLGDKINTKYDEDGVFIAPDGKQIFFSSKGHNSMGGFDIFTSLINDENGFWSEPVNYGYPVNTTDDDVFLITSPDGRRAFFSSDKEGGFGEKDIYMIQFPDYEPRDITVLVGKIINSSNEDISDSKVFIINNEKGDTTQVLNVNAATGKYGANLPVGSSYKTNYYVNGKLFYTENIDSPKGKGYRALKREVPYNGKNSMDTKIVIDTVKSTIQPAVAEVPVIIDHTKKVDHSLVIDTAQVIAHVPVIEKPTATDTLLSVLKKQFDLQKSSFQIYFKYNKKEIDTKSEEFQTFIKEVILCLRANPAFIIEIESSASTVPTKTYKTNENLANARANVAQNKVMNALLKNGFNKMQVNFEEPKAMVQGPEYKKDAKKNKSTYEQFQYIKIKVGLKK